MKRLSTGGRWLWCILFIGITIATLAGRPVLAADDNVYQLGSGDRIRVTVYNEKDLSGEYDVNDRGEVALPLIGQTKVAGLSVGQVETAVTDKYGKNYLINPKVTVEMVTYRPFLILGEVTRPGSYPYVNGMTVVTAVALAGGYTPRAKKSGMKITRGGSEQEGSEETLVRPGDTIKIGERFF